MAADKKVEIEYIADDKTKRATKSVEKNLLSLGSVAKTVGPLVTASFGIAAVKSSITAFTRQEAAIAQLEQRIKSTGGAAGFTSRELQDMASELQNLTTVGDEATIEMQSLLLTFTQIQGPVFQRAQESILNVAQAMGTDLKSAAIQVGKALNDPKGQLSALSRSGIQFTEDQKEMIKTMQEAGDVAGAQTVILKELETQFGGAAAAARDTMGGALTAADNSFGDLQETIGGLISDEFGLKDWLGDVTFLLDEMNRAIAGPSVAQRIGEISLELASVDTEIENLKANTEEGGFFAGLFTIDSNSIISDINILEAKRASLVAESERLRGELEAEAGTTGGAGAAVESADIDTSAATERFREQQFALTQIARFEREQRVQDAIEEGQQITDVWQLTIDERIAAETRAAQVISDIDDAASAVRLLQFSDFSTDMGTLQNGLAANSKKAGDSMFKAAQITGAAIATVDTVVAAVQAMKDPTAITPLQKFANYAAVFGKGLSAVAAIKAATTSGGGTPNAGGAPTASTTSPVEQIQATAPQATNITVNFETVIGTEEYTRDVILPDIVRAVNSGSVGPGGETLAVVR